MACTDGSTVSKLEEADGARWRCVYGWVEGDRCDPDNDEQGVLIGQALARLHDAGRELFPLPNRATMDLHTLIRGPFNYLTTFCGPKLARRFRRHVEVLRAELLRIRVAPTVVVHGDLQPITFSFPLVSPSSSTSTAAVTPFHSGTRRSWR